MSSEPPFEHPQDHTRYGEPPPLPGPPPVPRFLTPAYKIGCGLVLGFLLTQCCLCGTVQHVQQKMTEHLNAIDGKLDALNKKLDDAGKKPDGAEKKDK